jgi:hypothetical protein
MLQNSSNDIANNGVLTLSFIISVSANNTMSPCKKSGRNLTESSNEMVDHEMTDVSINETIATDAGIGEKGIRTPNKTDVLCGRGGNINTHPGNGTFRTLVEKNKRLYLTSRFKREKRVIAEGILHEIKRQSPPGRFLLKKDDVWVEISHEKARDKTSQALREGGPKIREEMKVEADARAKEEPRTPMLGYSSSYDERSSDNYYGSGNQQSYGSPNSLHNNTCNIMETMASTFICPTNLHDVRDDDRMYNTRPQQGNYQQKNGGNGWDQNNCHDHNPREQYDRGNGWDQSRYHDHNPREQYDPYGERSNYGHPSHHSQQVRQNRYANSSSHDHHLKDPYHQNAQHSPNGVSAFAPEQNYDPNRFGASSQPGVDRHPASHYHPNEPRTPPPLEDPYQSQSSWMFCQSSMFDIFSWTINGDEPSNNIPKVNSIDIDEPLSSSEMKGSSLVNVFEDSTNSVMEPLPFKSENDANNESMMSLTDSVLNDSTMDSTMNLLQTASLDLQFST